MDLRRALKNQHHAALSMMRQAVQVCPPDLWLGGEHPRSTWRIVFHAAAYVHLYLYPNLEAWNRWEHHRQSCTYLEGDAEATEPYTQAQLAQYVDLIDQEVDERIDALDLDEAWCGFSWYPEVTRGELLILSLRHLHGHLGQVHERLIARGLDVEWLGPPRESASATV